MEVALVFEEGHGGGGVVFGGDVVEDEVFDAGDGLKADGFDGIDVFAAVEAGYG